MKVPVYSNEKFEEMEQYLQENDRPFEPEEGVYDFIIKEAEDTISKAGNDTLKIKLLARISNRDISVFDWITITPKPDDDNEEYKKSEEYMSLLKKHLFTVKRAMDFSECIGLSFSEENMQPRNLINKEGKVLLKLEYNKEKQRNYLRRDMYMTKELLKKYYQEQDSAGASSEKFDDDIPF